MVRQASSMASPKCSSMTAGVNSASAHERASALVIWKIASLPVRVLPQPALRAQRVQYDARRWLAGKLAPATYGERQIVDMTTKAHRCPQAHRRPQNHTAE